MRSFRRVGHVAAPLLAFALLTWVVGSAGEDPRSVRRPEDPAALERRPIPPIVLADHPGIGAKAGGEQRHPWPVVPAVQGVEPRFRIAPAGADPTPGVAGGWFATDLAGRGPPPLILVRT